jgi:hypothetical protein
MALLIGKSAQKVWLYREKWHALALATLACLACLGVSLTFVSLAPHQTAFWFFSLAFGLTGAAILAHFPRFVRNLLRDNGAILLSADEAGLRITHGFGGSARSYPWSSVSEIVLTRKLKLVHADETTHVRHAIIVFLFAGQLPKLHWTERLKTGLAKTAHGRLYYLASFPRDGHHTLLNAFQEVAPNAFSGRYEPALRFVTMTGELSEQ